jgi:hypothetical protein
VRAWSEAGSVSVTSMMVGEEDIAGFEC